MSTSIQEKVIQIVASQLEVPPSEVSLESSFEDDLGADSLKRFQLIVSFEDAYGLDIPDEDSQKIATVQDAITYIQAKVKETQN